MVRTPYIWYTHPTYDTHTLHMVHTKGRSDVPCMHSYKFREVEVLLADHRLDTPSIWHRIVMKEAPIQICQHKLHENIGC